jgi:hypothetical protein
MTKHKVYKLIIISNINMLPGNLKGLPDESFFLNINLWRF